MGLPSNKRLIVAKIESVYGTDATPAGADAILLRNLDVKPFQGQLVSRDLIRPYLGNAGQLIAEKFAQVDFEVELQGSGTVGLMPSFDSLLRACGFAKSTTQLSITATCTGAVVTVTRTAHGYVTGDIVTHVGFTDTAKNIAAAITRLTADTYSYPAAAATSESPALGTPKINSAIVYTPISSSFESLSIYFFSIDETGNYNKHIILGARGNVQIDMTVKQIPVLKFSMTGLYADPTSSSGAPTPDYSGFKIPQLVNTGNTPGFSLASFSGAMESFTLNMANDVQYITLVGEETVKLLDRKPAGTLVFEAPLISTKDFFTIAKNATLEALTITHGSSNGYKTLVSVPNALISNPTLQDYNKVQMLSVPISALPSTGNDELTLTFE